MEKGIPIRIEKVGNGFIVKPSHKVTKEIKSEETMVFADVYELKDFIQEHFDLDTAE